MDCSAAIIGGSKHMRNETVNIQHHIPSLNMEH